jgi:hypothetical protein
LGEGEGTHLLSDPVRLALINSYLDNFKKTPLIFQPLNRDAPDPGVLVRGTNIAAAWPDGTNNGVGPKMQNVGWRLDCHGDMRAGQWNHMTDVYPQDIIKSGMSEAWKKAPVTLEICGTFLTWLQKGKYSRDTVEYIFEQGLKWHMSSFNAKSSAVPEEWLPLVNKWLNKMGYRYVLHKFTYPAIVTANGQLPITSWWENKAVKPIYRDYKFAIRLKNDKKTVIVNTDANIRNWLPGDITHDEKLYVPHDMPAGVYDIEIAIVSSSALEPKVKLAIEGINKDGWYPMGKIEVQKNNL